MNKVLHHDNNDFISQIKIYSPNVEFKIKKCNST